jgi:hypothetical protein
MICTSSTILHIITHLVCVGHFNHQNTLEMAQGHISLSESAHKHKEESSSSIKSQWKGDKKKKMKKVVYYETDSSSPSTSGSESASITSKHHERKKYSKMHICYPRISKRTPLISVPLGKPPMLEGE